MGLFGVNGRNSLRLAVSIPTAAALALSLTGLGSVSASAQVKPNSCGPSNAILHLQGNGNLYICSVGTLTNPPGEPYTLLEKTTHNRVWLHQNASGSGWADCYWADNVDYPLKGRDQRPGNVQVSSNTSKCP
jgi:hypothetical protein